MKAVGTRTKFMVEARRSGQMAVSTMVNGMITQCTVMESIHGPTAAATRGSICLIRNTAKEYSSGPTKPSTLGNGEMVSNTERVAWSLNQARKRRATGRKASV